MTAPIRTRPIDIATDQIMFYDHNCGFCSWTVSTMLRFDRAAEWRVMTIEEARDGDLRDILDDAVYESWHVRRHGVVLSGGKALAEALASLPVVRPLGLVLRRWPSAADRVYRAVVRRRSAFAWLIPERSKQAARSRLTTTRSVIRR